MENMTTFSGMEEDATRKHMVEHQIIWRIRSGNSHPWYDNWIREGDLYSLVVESKECDLDCQQVKDLIKDG